MAAIDDSVWISRLQRDRTRELPSAQNGAENGILSLERRQFPQAVGSEGLGNVEAGQAALRIYVISVVDGREQAIPAQARSIHGRDGFADRIRRLESKGVAKAV